MTYTPAQCADLREYERQASSCRAAAAAHHFDEVVWYRAVAGVLGAWAFGGWCFARRRVRRAPVLPEGFVATVGTTLFGAAAAVLLLLGAEAVVLGGDGVGQYLSGAVIAVIGAAAFGASFWRAVKPRLAAADVPVLVVAPPS